MKQIRHHHGRNRFAGNFVRGQLGGGYLHRPQPGIIPQEIPATVPMLAVRGVNGDLADELEALLGRLGAVKISLTLYLVEFGDLPDREALPLLAEAAGPCALLRVPARGRHLVIYLGPEPSPEAGGFPGRLERALAALAQSPLGMGAWAEIRTLRRCNHDIAAPGYLLQDLNNAAPRTIGTMGP